MSRYWSDVDGCWLECESVSFTGPSATHQLLAGEGRQQKYAPTFGARMDHELVTPSDLRGKGNADMPFNGRGTRAKDQKRPRDGSMKSWQDRCGCGRVKAQGNRRCSWCRKWNRSTRKPAGRKTEQAA
jgi:hypothetical protein